jgi:GTPase
VFRDQIKIFVRSGSGGAGSRHFRREKFVPRGGPDGGDGGRGGSVYAVADAGLNTLYRYVHQRHFRAEPGGNGSERNRHGAAGRDLLIPVPVGTVVHDESGVLLGDLAVLGRRLMVARGGRGGLGNTHFATATYQAPRVAEKGEPGEERTLILELKLIADVGIIGLPNGGKSTLLSVISAARPKIADYPFTTLSPNLGVAVSDDYSFVVADIPGLIEGAHEGLGLGHDFLRHVERTSVLIHVVDGADGDVATVLEHIAVIDRELALYRADLADRPQVIAVNKQDLPESQDNWAGIAAALTARGLTAFPISAATGHGIEALLRAVRRLLEEARARQAVATPVPETLVIPPEIQELRIEVLKGGGFRVHNRRAERAVAMTEMDNEEGLDRLQDLLRLFGVSKALEQAGVTDGDVVFIGDQELVWGNAVEIPTSRRLTRKEREAREALEAEDA